jgi:hypothetical protein
MQLACLAGAGALVLVAALSGRPLGPLKVLPRRVHHALDLALVVGLALSPLAARSDLDVIGVIVAEATAVILARLVLSTRYAAVPRVVRAGGAVVEASSRPAGGPEEAGSEPPADRERAAHHSASTAWTLGVLASRARRRGGAASVEHGARQLGRSLGWAARRRPG